MSAVYIRPAAETDLTDIFDFSEANWGSAQAEAYIAKILQMLDRIAADRRLGKPASGRHATLLRQACGSHFIIFARGAADIEIIRVLHQRMDIDTRLD